MVPLQLVGKVPQKDIPFVLWDNKVRDLMQLTSFMTILALKKSTLSTFLMTFWSEGLAKDRDLTRDGWIKEFKHFS